MKKLFFAIFLSILIAGPAYAAVSSDIALVEDTEGAINKTISYPLDNYQQLSACALYKKYQDIYDVIFIFTTYDVSTFLCTPSGYTVKESIKGIGKDYATNNSAKYCSENARLKHAVKLCDLDKYPASPDDPNGVVPTNPYTSMEVIAHEFGHYWLAMADYSQGGNWHCYMRTYMGSSGGGAVSGCDGYALSDFGVHWSFLFNNPSVMFGSQIADNQDGSFTITGIHPKYSPLDQYLMGLRSPESVPAMFVLKTMWLSDSTNLPLKAGDTKTYTEEVDYAERLDLTVQDVIAAIGERSPQQDPCHWKAAFVIVYPPGTPPTADQLAKVETYRQQWETYYDWATDHKGSMDTTLDGHGTGTATCKGSPTYPDGGVPVDAGYDAGSTDAATPDAGKTDAGKPDGGPIDGSMPDGGAKDGGAVADSGSDPDGGQQPEDGGHQGGDSAELDGGSSGGSGGCSCSSVGLK